MKEESKGTATTITCDVCRDLMPLVRDGVASDDSVALVEAHTAGCDGCCVLLEQTAPPSEAELNDVRILKKIRHRLALQSGIFALAGAVGAALLWRTTGGVYLVWWLPLLGALAYFVLRRHWWLAPALLGAGSFLALVGYYFMQGFWSMQSVATLLIYPLATSIGLALLTALGTAIGALLDFALKKEK